MITLHATSRLARAMAEVVTSPSDIRTLRQWAKAIGTSVTTLKVMCAVINVRPKAALDLARLARALIAHEVSQRPLGDLMDVSDDRTLSRLLERTGLRHGRFPHGYTIHRLLTEQQLVRDTELLTALKASIRTYTNDASPQIPFDLPPRSVL